MKESVYKVLAYFQRIVLPALCVLYTALDAALKDLGGLPYPSAVVGCIAAIDVFMGSLLQIDSNKWFADKEIVEKQGKTFTRLRVNVAESA